jgi:ATPase subunit of ABC transporter with duplicated ATPase domains
MRARFDDRELFGGDGADLVIRGPERIALTGANGVGKSTLLRLVNGDLEPTGGELKRGDGRIAYLSQRLDLLDLDRTVAENFAAYAPSLPDAKRMNLLARFLFRGARVNLPVGVLSGGERLRATLACVLCAEPAPQLLLLDEPTNNLDLVSVGQLESALSAYQGAFVVVSPPRARVSKCPGGFGGPKEPPLQTDQSSSGLVFGGAGYRGVGGRYPPTKRSKSCWFLGSSFCCWVSS